MNIEIRLLCEADLPAALRLKELARWNQTENDWKRLLQLEPNGCFCATCNGEVVGTTTTTTYGTELAWIGMVLVDPEYRRQGIGTKLMKTAMTYLDSAGVTTVKLDATPAGRPVYQELGFNEESLVERWEGTVIESTASRSGSNDKTTSDLLELDRKAFGADRTRLIRMLMSESSLKPCFYNDGGRWITGFALARQGTTATYIGPVVAKDAKVAGTLLDQMMGGLLQGRVYVDLNADFERGREILSERAFKKQRDLIRMAYGKSSNAGTSRTVFAIAGPELG